MSRVFVWITLVGAVCCVVPLVGTLAWVIYVGTTPRPPNFIAYPLPVGLMLVMVGMVGGAYSLFRDS